MSMGMGMPKSSLVHPDMTMAKHMKEQPSFTTVTAVVGSPFNLGSCALTGSRPSTIWVFRTHSIPSRSACSGGCRLGREDVRLQWQAAPLGTPITSTIVISGTGSWTDVGTTGVEINETISGLLQGRAYHWRARLQYPPGNALGQPAGPWVTIPINGWNETDLRTYTDNLVPLADAGVDQEVVGLSLVTLDGSGSSDPDGNLPLTYQWTQTGGLPVTLSSQTVVSPTFTAPAGSTVLRFSLVVTDSLGLESDPNEVVVKV